MKFDDYVNRRGGDVRVSVEGEGEMSLAQARDGLKSAAASMDYDMENRYKDAIFDKLGEVANLKDRRGRYVREVFSGSDIQEDGSRNRFLDMYTVFHSNVFTPTIPGMLHFSPIGKQEWHTFPQVAREVEKADDKTRLGAMKNYWQAGYDKDSGRITFKDQFTTRQDASAEAYKNDVPVIMHLMRMQSKEIHYSLLNSPSLAYINPIWFGLGRKMYKTAIYHTPGMESFTSTFHEPDWTPAPVKWAKNYYARRGMERETDLRHAIYGSDALAEEAGKTNDFFRWWRDWVYGVKFRGAPGWQPTKKGAKKDMMGNILE
ncbi:MAG: hypothetical protein WC717_05030 [Candidatus Micrarchaeia archaeon]|jgi:hypothetical protein